MSRTEMTKKVKEFKTKHKLNIYIDRDGEFHFYGTPEDKLELIKKLNNIKN